MTGSVAFLLFIMIGELPFLESQYSPETNRNYANYTMSPLYRIVLGSVLEQSNLKGNSISFYSERSALYFIHLSFDISDQTLRLTFSIKDFFSKCDQIRTKLWIWSHLRKKSLLKNFIFLCSVKKSYKMIYLWNRTYHFQKRSLTNYVIVIYNELIEAIRYHQIRFNP